MVVVYRHLDLSEPLKAKHYWIPKHFDTATSGSYDFPPAKRMRPLRGGVTPSDSVPAMPVDETIIVPLSDPRLEVRVIALRKDKSPGAFRYLQSMRQGTLKAISADPENTETALAYHRNEHKYFAMLADAVPDSIDAVLSPPSRMAWQAEPYRKAIIAERPNVADLTAAVSRTGNAWAAEGASLDDVLGGLSYRPTGLEKNFRRIVIVDDTFTIGTTAAAIALLLRNHGLPDECEVIFACPLWLDTFVRSP